MFRISQDTDSNIVCKFNEKQEFKDTSVAPIFSFTDHVSGMPAPGRDVRGRSNVDIGTIQGRPHVDLESIRGRFGIDPCQWRGSTWRRAGVNPRRFAGSQIAPGHADAEGRRPAAFARPGVGAARGQRRPCGVDAPASAGGAGDEPREVHLGRASVRMLLVPRLRRRRIRGGQYEAKTRPELGQHQSMAGARPTLGQY